MGCDAEVARYGTRWRFAQRDADAAWLATARDGIVPVLQSGGVVGTMPNIPANRINSQLDLAGPAFTVSAEEASGITALQLATRALRAGEIDAALVGAVDLSHEPVHLAALADLGLGTTPGDAAVVLTLKRLADARRDGDTVYATLALPDEQKSGVFARFSRAVGRCFWHRYRAGLDPPGGQISRHARLAACGRSRVGHSPWRTAQTQHRSHALVGATNGRCGGIGAASSTSHGAPAQC